MENNSIIHLLLTLCVPDWLPGKNIVIIFCFNLTLLQSFGFCSTGRIVINWKFKYINNSNYVCLKKHTQRRILFKFPSTPFLPQFWISNLIYYILKLIFYVTFVSKLLSDAFLYILVLCRCVHLFTLKGAILNCIDIRSLST